MLMETALEAKAIRRCPEPARPKSPRDGHALGDAIELMGASISVDRNAEIYGEKEPSDYFYKVVKGAVRTYKVLLDGRRQIGAFYLPGEIFGLEPGEEYAFSAEAIVDSKILFTRRNLVVSLAGWDPEIGRQLWRLTGRELQRAQNHLLLLTKTASERVASFLLEMDERIESSEEMKLTMSRRDIADYLGLTVETVSRMLTQFERASAIDLPSCKRIVLRNREELKRLVA
jgi:CRP/FNR family transcriptional regulator, nitrogen fixation regulation protein